MNATTRWTSPQGVVLQLRRVQPDDALRLQALVSALSDDDRRRRFHGAVKRLPGGELQRMTRVDGLQQMAVVVSAGDLLVADARAVLDDAGQGAEFALMVAPAWRGQGIATRCLRALEQWAAGRGLHRLHGSVLIDNAPMLGLMRAAGYQCVPDFDEQPMLRFERVVDPTGRRDPLVWLRRLGTHGGPSCLGA